MLPLSRMAHRGARSPGVSRALRRTPRSCGHDWSSSPRSPGAVSSLPARRGHRPGRAVIGGAAALLAFGSIAAAGASTQGFGLLAGAGATATPTVSPSPSPSPQSITDRHTQPLAHPVANAVTDAQTRHPGADAEAHGANLSGAGRGHPLLDRGSLRRVRSGAHQRERHHGPEQPEHRPGAGHPLKELRTGAGRSGRRSSPRLRRSAGAPGRSAGRALRRAGAP